MTHSACSLPAHRMSLERNPAVARTPSFAAADAGHPTDARVVGRRRFLGYLLAAPTLAVGAVAAGLGPQRGRRGRSRRCRSPRTSSTSATCRTWPPLPTSGLITVRSTPTAPRRFAVPRAEVGQGMTTAVAMMIAEELDLPLDKVDVTLADARPELLMNQLTGGSNSMRSIYTPVRTAAAIARQQLVAAAAKQWGVPASAADAPRDGVVSRPERPQRRLRLAGRGGGRAPRRSAVAARRSSPRRTSRCIGTPQNRIDALRHRHRPQAVRAWTCRCPNALPTMVAPAADDQRHGACRSTTRPRSWPCPASPTSPRSPTASRCAAQTFGQCIDAIQALDVTWGPGTVDGESDATVLAEAEGGASCRWSCRRC